MKSGFHAKTASVVGAAAFAALVGAAPTAMAQPAPAPLPVPAPAPDALPGPAPAPAEGAAAQAPPQATAGPVDPMADGAPHLSSPENLPPGTTDVPNQPQTRMSYLRDLWHAMQTQEVSGSDALLLLAQRPMTVPPNANMTPQPPPVPAPAPEPAPEVPPPAPIAP